MTATQLDPGLTHKLNGPGKRLKKFSPAANYTPPSCIQNGKLVNSLLLGENMDAHWPVQFRAAKSDPLLRA